MSSDVMQIGGYTLRFAAGGKLEQLTVHHTPLLHEGAYQLSIGAGRWFTVAGWDECWPSIEPYEDCPVMGMLIAARPEWTYAAGAATQSWEVAGFHATRRFEADGPGGLKVRFEVKNLSERACRFLWASHALFSLDRVRAVELPQQRLTGLELDGTCAKSFAANGGPVRIVRDSLVVELVTDQPWWGIWLNKGGWPAAAPAGFRCIGIEATSADSDSPGNAVLEPGQPFIGNVSLHAAAT